MRDKIFNDLAQNSATCGTNTYLINIRNNVRKYMDEHDLSANDFAKKSGVSPNTIHSILYKDIDDCRLSTAIAIAATIGIGVDELANTGAMPEMLLESIKIARSLPAQTVQLIRRYIRWQKQMYDAHKNSPAKLIDVMNLDYTNNHLRTTGDIQKVDISDVSDDIKSRVFRGVRIPCDDYLEFYNENDILLLADDREPRNRERAVISYYGRVFIVQREIRNGVMGYRGLRNSMFVTKDEVEYYFGYVVDVKRE